MRLFKVLAIAVAVVCVLLVVSEVLRILFLIGTGVLIAVAFFAVYKGWERYNRGIRRNDQSRAARRSRRVVESPRQQPTGFQPPATDGFDLDEELARLRRQRPSS